MKVKNDESPRKKIKLNHKKMKKINARSFETKSKQ